MDSELPTPSDTSPRFHDMFDIFLVARYQCDECGTTDIGPYDRAAKPTPALGVPFGEHDDLQRSLDDLDASVPVIGFSCAQCLTRKVAMTCEQITKCPNFLVVELGRFDEFGAKVVRNISISTTHTITDYSESENAGAVEVTYDTVCFSKRPHTTCFDIVAHTYTL